MAFNAFLPKAVLMAVPIVLVGGLSTYSIAGADNDHRKSVSNAPVALGIGQPQSCIPLRAIRQSKVQDDSTIDFQMRNGDIYRNRLPRRCGGLGFEQSFSYKTSLGRLCSTDIIHVISSNTGSIETRGSCGLGKFQKVQLVEAVLPDRTIDIMSDSIPTE